MTSLGNVEVFKYTLAAALKLYDLLALQCCPRSNPETSVNGTIAVVGAVVQICPLTSLSRPSISSATILTIPKDVQSVEEGHTTPLRN